MLSEPKICVHFSNHFAEFSASFRDVKHASNLYIILSHCALFNYSLSASFVLLVTLRICLLCTYTKITFLFDVLYLWHWTKFEFLWIDHNALPYAKILGCVPSVEQYNGIVLTDIYYSFRYDLNALTPGHIQLLPNSPTQNDSDSILTFYAALPSGNIIPKHILGTIFVNQQENILAIENMVQDLDEILAPSGEREILTTQQRENRVPILIINFPVTKVSV